MELTDLLDISLERANQFYSWGWRLSVFGAVITMLGIAALWIGTHVRDHDFELKISETILSAAKLGLEAGKAREVQEQLRKDNLTLQTNLEKEHMARLQLEGKTEGLGLDIAKANQAAAEANRIAEGERLARVRIQQQLSWRSLTSAQKDRIGNRILPFIGQQFVLVTYTSEGECLNFANELSGTALSGHWVLDPNRQWQALLNLVVGIEVHVSEKADARTKLAAAAIADSLTAEGISASVKPTPEKESPRPGLITIYVGKNPSSLQPITVTHP